jgi:hypothetical protein
MQVAQGKSVRATSEVLDLILANHELCTRVVECAESGGNAVAVQEILKAEFRGVWSKSQASLRKARVTARGQAELRSMCWAFEQAVDWGLISDAAIEVWKDV